MSTNTLVANELIVRLSGEIDLSRVPNLVRLEKQLSKEDSVVIDLSDVTYFDTTFLRFLRNLRKQPNKGDRSSIKIVGFHNKFRRIFELTGFSKIFDVEWRT